MAVAKCTGLLPESNGFVSDVMYDPNRITFFSSAYSENGSDPTWWNESIPIWITTTQQKKKTFVYNWPGCSVPITGTRPEYCQSTPGYQISFFEDNVKDALNRFKGQEGDFALIYTNYSDVTGHNYGPQSPEMADAIDEMDAIMANLFKEIKSDRHLQPELNVIILSDHGMTDYPKAEKRYSLSDVLNPNDIEFVTGSGVVVGITPKFDKLKKVYETLKTVEWATVWRKQDIPEDLHVKWNARTPPILLVAKPGYAVEPMPGTTKQIPINLGLQPDHHGLNGYDPRVVTEMNGIFLAFGPDIKQNYTTHHINIVDVYNMMSCILNVTGLHNNGTWANVCQFMIDDCNKRCTGIGSGSSSVSFLNLITLMLGIVVSLQLHC